MSAKKTDMHTYIIVLKIEQMNVGGVYNFELHCTLVTWFRSSASRAEVESVCKAAVAEPITLTSIESADFGDSKQSLPVHLVEKSTELSTLHHNVIEVLEKLPDYKQLEPKHTRAGWRPHVTTQGRREFKIGESIQSTSLYLIEAQGDLAKDPKDVFAEVKIGNKATA